MPPAPAYHATPGDHVVGRLGQLAEIALVAPTVGATRSPVRFTGYNVYRLSDWKRYGLLPGPERFQMIASFATDTLQGQAPLATIVDSTVDYDIVRYGRKTYRSAATASRITA